MVEDFLTLLGRSGHLDLQASSGDNLHAWTLSLGCSQEFYLRNVHNCMVQAQTIFDTSPHSFANPGGLVSSRLRPKKRICSLGMDCLH